MHDFVPLQKSQIFLRKAPLGMVALLIANIIDYAAELRMAIGECAETLLPAKPTLHLVLAIDKISRAIFYVPHHSRQGHRRL